MATFQLGDGCEYEGSVARVHPTPSHDPQQPSRLTLVCSTLLGDEQKNFPLSISLDHDEALRLAAAICEGLATPEPIRPKKLVAGGRMAHDVLA